MRRFEAETYLSQLQREMMCANEKPQIAEALQVGSKSLAYWDELIQEMEEKRPPVIFEDKDGAEFNTGFLMGVSSCLGTTIKYIKRMERED